MEKGEIGGIIRTLRKEVRKYQEPAITQVSRREDPFRVLISCILSLRTRDKVTAQASERLFHRAATPEGLLRLSEGEIQKAIYPVAFYRVKARNIKRVCRILLEKYQGKVPEGMEELLALPGVGRKTANIVLVYGYHKDALPIDTHCHRIPNRIGWIKTKTPEQTEMALGKLLPKKYWKDFNDIFVTFGQNICKPVGPKCSICPINSYCNYYRKTYLKRVEK